jgi:ssDNA-binding Zn-finger/Zn-ribbon topoisomerase 1
VILILKSRLFIHNTFYISRSFSLSVENMGLEHILSGKWFTRLVLIIWITCAGFVFVLLKNMELIVHGKLYYYGLIFSSNWADPYRMYTWLIYLCLGLPMALSGLALISSFLKAEEVPKGGNTVPQKTGLPLGVAKVASLQNVKEVSKRVENGNSISNSGGISCPNCKKVFSRTLVMLDFHGGKNRMVSVCPYCNYVLGNTIEEKAANENFHMATPERKTTH